MADQLRLRGGDKVASDNFTGADREVTVDTSEPNLRVHDGKTPGGHKVLMAGQCLEIEKEPCKVKINGDLEVEGNTVLHGDLRVEGLLDFGSGTLDLHDDDVVLQDQRDYGTGACNVKDYRNVQTQENFNEYVDEAIETLDEQLCIVQDDVKVLKATVVAIDDRVTQNEQDIQILNQTMIDMHDEVEDVEAALKLLELSIEKNASDISDNAANIARLEVLIGEIRKDLGDLELKVDALTLDDLTDVNLGPATEGDTLVFKSGKWTNTPKQCTYVCDQYIQTLTKIS